MVALVSWPDPQGIDWLAGTNVPLADAIVIILPEGAAQARPADLAHLVQAFRTGQEAQVACLCQPIDAAAAHTAAIVKVAVATNGMALYFSRAAVPHPDDVGTARYFQSTGIHVCRGDLLARFPALAMPVPEQPRELIQLDMLAAGIRFRAVEAHSPGTTALPPASPDAGPPPSATRASARRARLADIRLVITDVDGVLTDGGLYYDDRGECIKRFHVRDGLGIRMLEQSGVRVAVLSGRDSPALRKRVQELGISLSHFGTSDKAAACGELMRLAGVDASRTACTGDDSMDLPAFAVCGLGVTVADALDYVRQAADIVLQRNGGQGAFRELADSILLAQGKGDLLLTARPSPETPSPPPQR
jgi:3-deoxy-manno-octulosonate cytidylyltransferase (CMP-KDO synthetase)